MAQPPVTRTNELVLVFTNIQHASGSIYLGVYDSSEAYLKEKKVRVKKVIAVQSTGKLRVPLSDLPPGTYAVSAFHDVNGNGKMDKNFLGIPTEPYGFSNNARPRFRAPRWDETQFIWKGGQGEIGIRLETW